MITLVFAVATIAAVPSPAQSPAASTPCVAILMPDVQGVEGNAINVATGIQQLFSSYLTGPSIRVIALEAKLPALANDEARQKQCGNILQATFTRKHKNGSTFGKVVGSAGSVAAWTAPYGSSTGAAVARTAAIAGTEAAGTLASDTRATDEMRIEYKLTTPDGSVQLGPKEEKVKASTDGEDLLTPLVKQASEAVVTQIMKK